MTFLGKGSVEIRKKSSRSVAFALELSDVFIKNNNNNIIDTTTDERPLLGVGIALYRPGVFTKNIISRGGRIRLERMASPLKRPPRRRKSAKGAVGAPLSPVPEGPEADLSASGADNKNGVDDEPYDNGTSSADAIIATSTNCEHEESVTDAVAEDVVHPHQTNSVYGDVLSHLMALPFEAKSMLKFHQTKESHKAKDGRRKRKPARKNTIMISSQKQYLRGVGLMSESMADLAVAETKETKKKESKKKRRVAESSPAKAPLLHSNHTECVEFSPRSVKTLESPKRGDPQAQLNPDATTTDHLLLDSQISRDITAFQEQALMAQMQQAQLFHNHHNIASLYEQQELQELQLLQQQFHQQQQHSYYYPAQAINHHLYHQMLTTNYSFNPYQSFQQQQEQQQQLYPVIPQLLQPFLHEGVVHNPNNDNDAAAAAVAAAAAAAETTTTTTTEAANENAHPSLTYNDFVAAPTTADLLSMMKSATGAAATIARKSASKKAAAASPQTFATDSPQQKSKTFATASPQQMSATFATASPQQKLTKSNRDDVAALPVAFGRNLDNDESGIAADVAAAKWNVQGEDAISKMKPKKDAVKSEREIRREERAKAANKKAKVKDGVKVVYSPDEKRKGQNNGVNGNNSVGKRWELPPGWTTLTLNRKNVNGTYKHYVSPNNTVFRSLKNVRFFITISEEMKNENDGKEPSEEEVLVVFGRRGHRL
jgi:hypothetical protein